jgi:disulfide oxidoreductase YuzD
VEYVDLSRPDARESQATLVAQVTERGLLYPVTFVDGSPVYDGAVSYPAILRAVEAATA